VRSSAGARPVIEIPFSNKTPKAAPLASQAPDLAHGRRPGLERAHLRRPAYLRHDWLRASDLQRDPGESRGEAFVWSLSPQLTARGVNTALGDLHAMPSGAACSLEMECRHLLFMSYATMGYTGLHITYSGGGPTSHGLQSRPLFLLHPSTPSMECDLVRPKRWPARPREESPSCSMTAGMSPSELVHALRWTDTFFSVAVRGSELAPSVFSVKKNKRCSRRFPLSEY